MKLTKAARRELEAALRNAERASRYIHAEHIAVCRRDTQATTALHYRRNCGEALIEVNRTYGSDLVGLQTAIEGLRHFLATH